jgi:hypothetical protein
MANLKEAACLEKTVHIGSSISADGQAATITFNDLAVGLGRLKKQPLESTLTASLVITMDQNDTEIPVQQDIHGFLSIDPGARVALVTHLPGQTILVDLLEGPCANPNFSRRFISTLPAGGDYRTSFFLLADRNSDDPEAGVLLTIDKLDIQLGKQNSKNKRLDTQ